MTYGSNPTDIKDDDSSHLQTYHDTSTLLLLTRLIVQGIEATRHS